MAAPCSTGVSHGNRQQRWQQEEQGRWQAVLTNWGTGANACREPVLVPARHAHLLLDASEVARQVCGHHPAPHYQPARQIGVLRSKAVQMSWWQVWVCLQAALSALIGELHQPARQQASLTQPQAASTHLIGLHLGQLVACLEDVQKRLHTARWVLC